MKRKVFNVSAFDAGNKLVFAFSTTKRRLAESMWENVKFAFIKNAVELRFYELLANGQRNLLKTQRKGITTPKEAPIHGQEIRN